MCDLHCKSGTGGPPHIGHTSWCRRVSEPFILLLILRELVRLSASGAEEEDSDVLIVASSAAAVVQQSISSTGVAFLTCKCVCACACERECVCVDA